MSTRTRAGQEQVTQTSTVCKMNGTRDTDVEDDNQNEHHADLHIHKDKYVVVSYAGKNGHSLHRLGVR